MINRTREQQRSQGKLSTVQVDNHAVYNAKRTDTSPTAYTIRSSSKTHAHVGMLLTVGEVRTHMACITELIVNKCLEDPVGSWM